MIELLKANPDAHFEHSLAVELKRRAGVGSDYSCVDSAGWSGPQDLSEVARRRDVTRDAQLPGAAAHRPAC